MNISGPQNLGQRKASYVTLFVDLDIYSYDGKRGNIITILIRIIVSKWIK